MALPEPAGTGIKGEKRKAKGEKRKARSERRKVKSERRKAKGEIISLFASYCAPGMGDNYRVEDPNTLGSRKC